MLWSRQSAAIPERLRWLRKELTDSDFSLFRMDQSETIALMSREDGVAGRVAEMVIRYRDIAPACFFPISYNNDGQNVAMSLNGRDIIKATSDELVAISAALQRASDIFADHDDPDEQTLYSIGWDDAAPINGATVWAASPAEALVRFVAMRDPVFAHDPGAAIRPWLEVRDVAIRSRHDWVEADVAAAGAEVLARIAALGPVPPVEDENSFSFDN